MKSVLISIHPEWCEKIVNGKKTIEVRKTAPKEVPFKAYIYCTKVESNWQYRDYVGAYVNSKGKIVFAQQHIIGEFVCDRVDEYTFSHYEAEYRVTHVEQEAMGLNQAELIRYGKGKPLYGLHITDLKIYDKPKELSEFYATCRYKNDDGTCRYCRVNCYYQRLDYNQDGSINLVECGKKITRPPQSWQYVDEVKE